MNNRAVAAASGYALRAINSAPRINLHLYRIFAQLDTHNCWMRLVLAMASVMAVVVFCLSLERYRLNWLAFLGRASLAIYVMHILAGSGTRIILQKLMGMDMVFVHLAAGTMLGIGLPLLVLRLADRFKLSVWLGLAQGARNARSAIASR